VPRTAADALVVKKNKEDNEMYILLITRKKETFHGKYAYPGGHCDYGEDPYVSVLRELEEECGVIGSKPVLVDVKGKPERDPRYHVISFFFLVEVAPDSKIVAGDDAATADWYKVRELLH
jgi:8-oxo-dGTP diphosphatase